MSRHIPCFACAVENIHLDKNYKNRNIYIQSDSQAAIKVVSTSFPKEALKVGVTVDGVLIDDIIYGILRHSA
jgi:hypothetical protein